MSREWPSAALCRRLFSRRGGWWYWARIWLWRQTIAARMRGRLLLEASRSVSAHCCAVRASPPSATLAQGAMTRAASSVANVMRSTSDMVGGPAGCMSPVALRPALASGLPLAQIYSALTVRAFRPRSSGTASTSGAGGCA